MRAETKSARTHRTPAWDRAGMPCERKSERVTNEQEELRRPLIPAKAGTQ
ncbi:hypothetical protein PMI02_02106 [Novosphingobium sp. AP12]|nr:hypothetical protein PMI02_02106 [Novosphingobium sp. AP12]